VKNPFSQRPLLVSLLLLLIFFLRPFGSQAQEYVYGLTNTGGHYNLGAPYQIETTGQGFVAYESFDGKNGGNAGNGSGFIQIIYQDRVMTTFSALTMAGDQNLNHGTRVDIIPGQGGLLPPFNFMFSADGSGFNPGGKFLLASDGLLYGMTSTEGQSGGGSLFYKTAVAGPNLYPIITFDGPNRGRSPKGSMIQGPDGLLFGMTEFGGSNDLGVIFSFSVATKEFTKIMDFTGAANGAHPTGSLLLASDGKLYGMTRAGGASNNGVIFRVNIDGTAFIKLQDLSVTSGSAPLGSLIQHTDGLLYGMTSAGGTNSFGTIFSLTTTGVFQKLVDFTGVNGKSPVGDLFTSPNGQLYGVAHSGGAHEKGVFFKLENGLLLPLYHFQQSTGGNPVGSLMMKRKYPDMTFDDMGEQTATSAAFTPPIQTTSGLPIYLLSSDPTVAVIENNQIKPLRSGTVVITAYQVGNHEYLSRSLSKTLSVVRAEQIIDFAPIPPKTFGDSPFTLSATSSSGLPVYITAFSNEIISSDGVKFYIQNAGKIEIRAVQEGNAIYEPAVVRRELVVNRADQTITFNSPGDKFCCQPFYLTASASSGLDVSFKTLDWSKLSIYGSSGTIVGTGPAQITAYNNGNRNYKPAEKSQTINLLKGYQSILFSIPTNVTYRYGQGDVYLNTGSSSGLPVTYTSDPPGIAVVEGSTLRLIGVGTTKITATQGGNQLMNAAIPISQTVTVASPATPGTGNSITFGDLFTYYVNDAPFNLIGKSTSGLPVSYQSSNTAVAEINGNLVILKGAGSTTITASQAGNNAVTAAVPVQRNLTIIKRSQYINLESSYYVTFGTSPIPLPSRSSANLLLTYTSSDPAVAKVDENYLLHIVSSGRATVMASQSGNAEYDAAPHAYSQINITGLYQTITFPEIPAKTFGDSPFAISATASSGLPVELSSSDTQVATIDGSMITIRGAGSTVIKATQNGYPGYGQTETTRTLVVNKATQVITFAALPEKNFRDYPFAASATSSVHLPVTFSSSNPSIAGIDGNKIIILGAGTVDIIASQAGNENYLPAEALQKLKISDAGKTFDMIGATSFGGPNNAGVVYSMQSDGSNFVSLQSFSPRTLPQPQSGLIKGSDGRLYGMFSRGGTHNHGAVVRLNADGSDMTLIYSFSRQNPGTSWGNIFQASDGDLYGMTRIGGPDAGGIIFKVKTDGSGYTTLHVLRSVDGIMPMGGLTEASNGRLYGMTPAGGLFGSGTIFSLEKNGSDFNVIFRFGTGAPVNSGFNPRGDLVQGTDGYFYGTLSGGGENGKGVVFKILPDGSDFTKIIDFDGATKGATPGASLLIGSNGKIYGLTQSGGTHNQGALFVVDNDGANFARLFDFDGANTGGTTLCKLTEGTDGLLYGTANGGGANALGTVFKISKNGTGFQKLADLNASASRPVFGPLAEGQPGKFFGMTSTGGPGEGGAVFSITSAGAFSVVKDFPQEESLPHSLVADPTGEFYYGLAMEGKPTIFRVSSSAQYERILELPPGVLVHQLFYISTGHLWCIASNNGEPYVFRIKPDGTELQPLSAITANIPYGRNVQWLTEKSDGTIFGITTRATVDEPGMIFSIKTDGTAFSSLGFMPVGVEFTGNYLRASDGYIYAVSGYTHALYRYEGGASNPMKKIVALPQSIGQVPMKLIELNGGRIGVAMRSGQIFSVEKDGSQFKTIHETTSALGSSPADMLQTFDGWIYVSASQGGQYGQGAIYKILADGSSYSAIRSFNEDDGDTPNNFFFKKIQQTLTFDPIDPKKVSDPSFMPDIRSNSGARIALTSSNPAVAIIAEGKVKPVGVGTTIITASIPANANYYHASALQRELTVDKGIQSISFPTPGDKVIGDAPFVLTATSDAGLDVQLESLSQNISINGTTLTILSAGVARVRAIQQGNNLYLAAASVEVSFCINPRKPSVTATGIGANISLQSSNNSGNQWYQNNDIISGATQPIFAPDEAGTYTVITTVEGCSGIGSDPYEFIITGISNDPMTQVHVYPNPVTGILHVQLTGYRSNEVTIELLNSLGQIVEVRKTKDSNSVIDVTTYTPGLYFIKVIQEKRITMRKVLKQ
jgi:uncharacterized repeat protein (TIGR03803 family)